jgi:hypothetical protein
VKERLLSSQSFEDDSSLWVGELCKVREAEKASLFAGALVFSGLKG